MLVVSLAALATVANEDVSDELMLVVSDADRVE
jgi:hypothetical protein